MLSFYLYILKCSDSSYYIGHTDDIEKRLSEHHLGLYANYTSTRRPVELVYMEAFPTRHEAVLAEKKLKKWTRAKKEAFMKKDVALLTCLAKRKSP